MLVHFKSLWGRFHVTGDAKEANMNLTTMNLKLAMKPQIIPDPSICRQSARRWAFSVKLK